MGFVAAPFMFVGGLMTGGAAMTGFQSAAIGLSTVGSVASLGMQAASMAQKTSTPHLPAEDTAKEISAPGKSIADDLRNRMRGAGSRAKSKAGFNLLEPSMNTLKTKLG